MISIREETTSDHESVRAITIEAFSNSDFGHNGEADLIDELRCKCDRESFLSLVACNDDEVVGHILFTPAIIKSDEREWTGMSLAPMSVSCSHQKSGIGSKLVTEGLNRLMEDDCPFVIVLGHPTYYPRFGFIPASESRIKHGFVGMPQDVLFVHFGKGNSADTINGDVYFHSVFGPQHDGS